MAYYEKRWYECDLCDNEQDTYTEHLPRNWDEIDGQDVCEECVKRYKCPECDDDVNLDEGKCDRCIRAEREMADDEEPEQFRIMRGEL